MILQATHVSLALIVFGIFLLYCAHLQTFDWGKRCLKKYFILWDNFLILWVFWDSVGSEKKWTDDLNCLFLVLFAGVVDSVIPNSRYKGGGVDCLYIIYVYVLMWILGWTLYLLGVKRSFFFSNYVVKHISWMYWCFSWW